MSISSNIRKILSVVLFTLVSGSVIVLLVAAVRVRNSRICTGIEIDINGQKKGTWFIDKADILKVLTANNNIPLKNMPVLSVDLAVIESRLKNEVWIRNAELFFDNNGVLKVLVQEREPVARIFSSSGTSFYIDSTGQRLPLSDKMSVKLPVFTGFPNDGRKLKAKDKKLICDIRDLSMYLLTNPFWMAQVSQTDITPSRGFEIVPTIGNHLIEFGDGSAYEDKFRRLMIFYKNVLAKTGMDKYERIKVQYEGQVIGVRKKSLTPETKPK
jgi:cell division protein FtsQ